MYYNKKNFISILVTNYNKERFLKKSIKSCLKQNFRNKEVVIFDDCSSDKSITILKKFSNIKVIKNNKKKYLSGPLNQIYGLSIIFKKSKGEIIFLLDSDDEYKLNKVSKVSNMFKKNQNLKFLQDTPLLTSSKKKAKLKKKITLFTIWPSFYPTSCIAVRKSFLKSFFKLAMKDKFPNLEIDARLSIFAFLNNEFKVTNKSLTYYNYDQDGITSRYNKFNVLWWKKRNEAFEYTKFLSKKLKLNFYRGPDYYITKIINLYFSIFYKSYH